MQKKTNRNEYRFDARFEVRAEEKKEGGKKLILRGYPIVFNEETKIYDYWYGEIREKILATALDGTDLSNVYLITGHNPEPDKVLGRNGVNMRLEVDDTGLFFECELPNTQHARDIYNLIESGLVDGMSFGFTCGDEVNTSTMERTITHIDELFEISITPFPAYKQASVVVQDEEARKAETEEQEKLDKEKAEKQEKTAKEMEELFDD